MSGQLRDKARILRWCLVTSCLLLVCTVARGLDISGEVREIERTLGEGDYGLALQQVFDA